MDVSAGLASAADTAVDTATTQSSSFEDKLRQEVVLVPEDLADIHIEATTADPADAATTTDVATADTDPATTADTDTPSKSVASVVAGRTPPRKKNLKKKQGTPAPVERTIEQRREQVRPIIDRLTELQMNVSYPAIRELYKQLSHFIKTGEDAKIKIPFPEFSRRIKGELSNATYIPCWVKLEME
jgi:RNase adaptor protein for sRNA GlmZ degradation